MFNTRVAALTIAAFSALAFGAAPWAAAAPSGDASAQEVVDSLQRNGFKVILNRTGAGPLQECDVAAVRPGRKLTEVNTTGEDRQLVTTYSTVYVDARC
jgi:hypothetical protein